MDLMSLQELGMVLGGEVFPDFPVRGFAVDSRLVSAGFVFFALKGEKSDGHDFLKEVALKGAICAVVSEAFEEEIPGLYLIRVKDPLESLQYLARRKISKKKIRCIGITGSVGKTTTKEFIATLLSGAFKVLKTIGNANSQTGVPLCILNNNEEGDVFVIEMGMSSHGNISNLLKMASPEIVVMTKVALAHALFFPGGLEEIAAAKAEILSHPDTRKAFIHIQARQFQAFQKKDVPEKVFYGLAFEKGSLETDVLLHKKGDLFSIEKDTLFDLPFKETHLVENFLVAALVAREFGMSWDLILKEAKRLAPFEKRFEKIEKEGITFVNDAYNANPESVKAALENLPIPKQGKKVVAVLGEMRELGSFSQKAHQEIGKIASSHVDLLLCLAGDSKHMADEFSLSGKPSYFFEDLNEVKSAMHARVEEGDVVLVKASKSLKLWEVLDPL